MTQEEEAAQAVTKGIAWLEECYGAPWQELRQRITGPIEIKSQWGCVLSKLSGDSFSATARRLGLSNARAAELGFTVRYPEPFATTETRVAFGTMWPVLQREWERATAHEEWCGDPSLSRPDDRCTCAVTPEMQAAENAAREG